MSVAPVGPDGPHTRRRAQGPPPASRALLVDDAGERDQAAWPHVRGRRRGVGRRPMGLPTAREGSTRGGHPTEPAAPRTSSERARHPRRDRHPRPGPRRRRAGRGSDGGQRAQRHRRRDGDRRDAFTAGRPAPARSRRPPWRTRPAAALRALDRSSVHPLGRGRLDRVVQPLQCVVEAGLDRPGRHVEPRRDVLDGQIAVEPQGDDDLVIW